MGSIPGRLVRICYVGQVADAQVEKTLTVGDEEIRGEQFVLATGSRPQILSISGLDSVPYLTSDTVMSWNGCPSR